MLKQRMALDQELLKILVCPETHLPVSLASPELVEQLNARIVAGTIKNRHGALVADKVDGALVRSDGKVLYPVREDIPIMLVDEAIELP